MNDSGSIAEFFYNIVPGSLVLFLLKSLYGFDILKLMKIDSDNEAIVIFSFIILSLFLGFFFQCITKIIRGWRWNRRAFLRVKENNEIEFDKACIDILGKNYIKDNCIDKYRTIYFMDNYLRGEKPAFLPTHFSSRFAFWANLCLGTFALIICGLITAEYKFLYLLLPFLLFSLWMADEHLFNFYDSILKSYFMHKLKK